jgi:hypothetical protein
MVTCAGVWRIFRGDGPGCRPFRWAERRASYHATELPNLEARDGGR